MELRFVLMICTWLQVHFFVKTSTQANAYKGLGAKHRIQLCHLHHLFKIVCVSWEARGEGKAGKEGSTLQEKKLSLEYFMT